jgi:hypothetical protein
VGVRCSARSYACSASSWRPSARKISPSMLYPRSDSASSSTARSAAASASAGRCMSSYSLSAYRPYSARKRYWWNRAPAPGHRLPTPPRGA